MGIFANSGSSGNCRTSYKPAYFERVLRLEIKRAEDIGSKEMRHPIAFSLFLYFGSVLRSRPENK